MLTHVDLKSSGYWYVSHLFDDPERLPHGCIVRISNADFSRDEAIFLLANLRDGNDLASLHFQRDSGMGTITFLNGEKVCVYVGIKFTVKIGEQRISIRLPTLPGHCDARTRIRTADRDVFTNIQDTSVIL